MAVFSCNRFLEHSEKRSVGDGGPTATEENAEEMKEALWPLELELEWELVASAPRWQWQWQWQGRLLDDSLRDGKGPVQWPGQKVLQDHALEGRRRVRVVVMVINMVVQRSDRPLLVEGVEGDVFPDLFHGPPPRCLRDEDRSVRGRGRPGGGGGGRQHPVVATVTVSVGAALVLMAVVRLL
ncbi:hypothetical protein GW17_00049903 [Ensete ventricosum]|nr:hypothetical protein GW17_00049903 [Ensete ventricosum]